MEVITVRLHKTYMDIAEVNPSTPVLRRISAMAQKSSELKAQAAQASSSAAAAATPRPAH